jgi:PadR family transcriptional regulator, regulatory protein PadR
MDKAIDPVLLQGTLDLMVLKTLGWGPRHGFAIARWLRARSAEAVQVEDRALYLALHRLEERGLVASEWGLSENNRRARYYTITPAGRAALQAKSSAWARYVAAVTLVLQATDAEAGA